MFERPIKAEITSTRKPQILWGPYELHASIFYLCQSLNRIIRAPLSIITRW